MNRLLTPPRVLLWIVLLLLYSAVPVQGEQRNEDPSEAMVRKIARDLRCAVCQNQSVYESNSDLAKDMLAVVREKIRAGVAEEEIRRYFFERYGDYIYLEPTQAGKNWILWLAPLFGLIIGGGALWMAIGRWQRTPAAPVETVTSMPTQEAKTRIQQELDRIQL